MPRFMIFVPGSPMTETGALPPKEIVAMMSRFNGELKKAGVLVELGGLLPTSRGAKLTYDAPGKVRVTDGPFTEAKELVAGFWLIECTSRAEAIEWMSRAPMGGGVSLELREVADPADWPAELREAGTF